MITGTQLAGVTLAGAALALAATKYFVDPWWMNVRTLWGLITSDDPTADHIESQDALYHEYLLEVEADPDLDMEDVQGTIFRTVKVRK